MTENNDNQLFQLLSEKGYDEHFVKSMLPSWWDDSVSKNPLGKQELIGHLSRATGTHFHSSEEGALEVEFELPHVRKLKRGVIYTPDQLTPVMSIAYSLARIAAKSCVFPYTPLSDSPFDVISDLKERGAKFTSFKALLTESWKHGIPVLYLENLPNTSKMDGMAVFTENRPVIILSKKTDIPSWMSFILAHEMGHIAKGHCLPDQILVDEDLHTPPEGEQDIEEDEADNFALNLLSSGVDLTEELNREYTANQLLEKAMDLQRIHGLDAGHVILRYGYLKNKWGLAISLVRGLSKETESPIDMTKEALYRYIKKDAVPVDSIKLLFKICGLIKNNKQ